MASFQTKIGWKWMRNRENKNLIPFRSYTTRKRKFSKSIKKLYKIQNIIKDSFLAKIGWRRLRKRENKNYHSVSYLLDAM